MNEMEKSAKLNVLKKLKDAASARMKGGLQGMKKVSVMSDSPEGLKEGLHKAEDMMPDEKKDMVHPEASKIDMFLKDLSEEECMELKEKLEAKMGEHEPDKEMGEDESKESEDMMDY